MPDNKKPNDLYLKSDESFFSAFDPSNYCEIQKYDKCSLFSESNLPFLLGPANRALQIFTRAHKSFKKHVNENLAFHSKRKTRNITKIPNWFASELRVYRLQSKEFEEVLIYAHSLLQQSCENNGCNDSQVLAGSLYPELEKPFKSSSGIEYEIQHIFSMFALWKLDCAAVAYQNERLQDYASLVSDAYESLRLAEQCQEAILQYIHRESEHLKNKSKAGSTRTGLQDVRSAAKEKYFMGNKGEKWHNPYQAGKAILSALNPALQAKLSPTNGHRTISGWIKTDFDPSLQMRKK